MMEITAAKALAKRELSKLAFEKTTTHSSASLFYRFMHKRFTLAAEPDEVAENARNCLRAVSESNNHVELIQAIASAGWHGGDAKHVGINLLREITQQDVRPIGDSENTFIALRGIAPSLTNADLPEFANALLIAERGVCAENVVEMKPFI